MAQYNIGNVTLVNASTQVVGASCDWITADAVRVGDMLKKNGENAWYNVTAVQTATRVSISPPYAGANASAVGYAITRDFTPNLALPEVSSGDLDWQDSYTRAARILDTQVIAYSVIRGETYAISSGSGRFGWAVGHSATPGMVVLANASSGGDAIPAIGVIATDNGTTVNVYYRGPLASYPGGRFPATGGARFYLRAWNTTATYNLTNTAPILASYIVQFIGTNKSASSLMLDIQENYIEL
jgi:hypothetical protein